MSQETKKRLFIFTDWSIWKYSTDNRLNLNLRYLTYECEDKDKRPFTWQNYKLKTNICVQKDQVILYLKPWNNRMLLNLTSLQRCAEVASCWKLLLSTVVQCLCHIEKHFIPTWSIASCYKNRLQWGRTARSAYRCHWQPLLLLREHCHCSAWFQYRVYRWSFSYTDHHFMIDLLLFVMAYSVTLKEKNTLDAAKAAPGGLFSEW